MIYQINGEQPFQVLSTNFSVSPSESGYNLQISANGIDYTDFATVGAGVTRQFTGMANGNFYRLSGNTGTVEVNWMRECSPAGGGGAAGVSSLDGQTGALTTKTIGGQSILGEGDIPVGGSDEYNQIREIEHNDYVSYTFTHSGETWGNWQAWVAQITNGENSFRYGIWQGSAGDMRTSFYASGYSDGVYKANNGFLRPIMREASFYERYPDFYVKFEQEGSSDDITWTFAVPSSYTVEVLSLEDYSGFEFAGSAITSFTEIAPASPIYLDESYSANTFNAAVQRYIVTHRFEEEFSIYGETYWLQRSQNGDPGWLAAVNLGIGDDGSNIYLSFYGRFGKYLLNWTFDGGFLLFGEQAVYDLPTASASTLGGVKVGNGLSIDSNGVLSAKVVALSQSDYDALVQAGTVDANTLYIII